MARQKLPQHKDDCIKCKLPEDGSYRHCMNCRNKAVQECIRLESLLISCDGEPSTSETKANELSPLVSVCSRCGKKPKHKESIYCIDCLYERKMSGY